MEENIFFSLHIFSFESFYNEFLGFPMCFHDNPTFGLRNTIYFTVTFLLNYGAETLKL